MKAPFQQTIQGATATLIAMLALLLDPEVRADEAASALAPSEASAARKPLWEAGVVGTVSTTTDYPASDRYRVRVLPIPYFVYRGVFLRADENGTRVRTKVRSNVELDISADASFDARSNGAGPRAGMPNLDYLLELGPNLKVVVAQPSPDVSWRLELPVRAAISVGSHWGYQGLVFAPSIGIHDRSLFGSAWHGSAEVGPEFVTSRLQKYFYQVDPQYSRPDRPAYIAQGGYFGTRLELSASREFGRNFRVFGLARIDDYSGARNVDSPLFKAHWGYTAFVGASWSFWQSQRTVPSLDVP